MNLFYLNSKLLSGRSLKFRIDWTSQRAIPHFKRGKRLYFKKEDLAEWVTQKKVVTQEEIEKQALNYIIRNPRTKFK